MHTGIFAFFAPQRPAVWATGLWTWNDRIGSRSAAVNCTRACAGDGAVVAARVVEAEEAVHRFHFSARSQLSSPGLLQLLYMPVSGRAAFKPNSLLFHQEPTSCRPDPFQLFENLSHGGK